MALAERKLVCRTKRLHKNGNIDNNWDCDILEFLVLRYTFIVSSLTRNGQNRIYE
jgi:hypothetical protein